MITLRIDKPSDKQDKFLRSECRHVAFGGARGGGKSWCVRTKATLLALKYPGIKCLIVRRTFPELNENHIREMTTALYGIARYNKVDKLMSFPNGSKIKFDYCARDSDLDHFQGTEYDVIFIDEATQLSEYQMKTIEACNRGTGAFPRRMYYTCNPGGQGHAYIKRVFVDRKFKDNEDPNDFEFIQSFVTDNHALMESDPDYVKKLEALPPKLREAWLYGSWDIFEGQFFEEFVDDPKHYRDRRHTHVIDPFEVPQEWRIYMSMDWGYSKPFSVGWWAIDYDGRAYRIVEWYGAQRDKNGETLANEGLKMNPDQVFKEIHRIEVEHPWLRGKKIMRVADPAMWDSSTGVSIAETASKCGVLLNPADHNRIAGWMQMHYRLHFDENGIPMMYVFRTCKEFIRTIPLLEYDEFKAEDLDTDEEDHAADEARYFCMARPIEPAKEKQVDPFDSSPLHTIFGLKKEDLAPAPRKPTAYIVED